MQLVAFYQKITKMSALGDVNQTVFLLVMLLIYLNSFLYLMDLYSLVKKKTAGETVMVMLLPGTITVMGTVMFSFFLQIPESTELERVWMEMASPGLWTELLCLVGLFGFLLCLAWLLWRRKRENRAGAVQWILSYSLDFLVVVLAVAEGVSGLAGGTDFLVLAGGLTSGLGFNLFLCLFLYGVAALVLKMGLLVLAGLTQLFSVRISHFPYQEGKNPMVSFLLYGILCQNARVRGALAYWVPMLVFAGWTAVEADRFVLRVMFPIFIVLAFLLYLLMALRPVVNNMERFARWGDRNQVLARFCREYFLEEPVLKTRDFTVTRHFLADERGMIEVYAFDWLADVKGNWVSEPKKGWVRNLSFLDGGCCTVCREDMGADEIFRYARRYWEMQRLTGQPGPKGQQAVTGEGLYYKLFYFVIAALVMLLIMMQQIT